MDGFQAGIHALLQDIKSNYGDSQHVQNSLPFSRPPSSHCQSQRSISGITRQIPAPIYDQQQLSAVVPSMLPGTYPNDADNDTSLDNFGESPQCRDCRRSADLSLDRDLLAEPTNRLSWQSSNVMSGLSPRRLTLPGHTAPYSPPEPFERRKTQLRRPGQHCRAP